MRKNYTWLTALLMVGLVLNLMVSGCSNEEEENYKKGIKSQIAQIEKEVNQIEQHQNNMRKMIAEMKVQLDSMQAELDKEAPRIHTAQTAIKALRETTSQSGESALEYTAQHPSYNFFYLMLFLLLLWIFWRLKVRSSKKQSQT